MPCLVQFCSTGKKEAHLACLLIRSSCLGLGWIGSNIKVVHQTNILYRLRYGRNWLVPTDSWLATSKALCVSIFFLLLLPNPFSNLNDKAIRKFKNGQAKKKMCVAGRG